MKSLLTALTALVLAPTAQPQEIAKPDPCAAYKEFSDAALLAFKDWRGKPVNDVASYSTRNFPDFSTCMIAINRAKLSLVLARQEFEERVAVVRSCFPDWQEAPAFEIPDGPGEQIDGRRFLKKVPQGQLVIGMMLVGPKSPGLPVPVVGIGFLLLPPEGLS